MTATTDTDAALSGCGISRLLKKPASGTRLLQNRARLNVCSPLLAERPSKFPGDAQVALRDRRVKRKFHDSADSDNPQDYGNVPFSKKTGTNTIF
jgi:hypothetical protein